MIFKTYAMTLETDCPHCAGLVERAHEIVVGLLAQADLSPREQLVVLNLAMDIALNSDEFPMSCSRSSHLDERPGKENV